MVAQALPLVLLAEAMGMSIPIVTEYYKAKGIDLSGYDANDIVPLEVLLPEQAHMKELKSQKDWSQSYYKPKPVVGDTDVSGVVVQSKKDDDEVIDVKEEELEVMPSTELTTGDEPPDPDKDPEKWITMSAEQVAQQLAEEGVKKLTNKAIEKLKNKFNQLEKEKTDLKREFIFPQEAMKLALESNDLELLKKAALYLMDERGRISGYRDNIYGDTSIKKKILHNIQEWEVKLAKKINRFNR